MTLKQFILKSKMDSAMAELTDTNHTVSQIAYNVGFQDAHNFSHGFPKTHRDDAGTVPEELWEPETFF